MRVAYLVPQVSFLYFLWTLEEVRLFDLLGLIIVCAGVFIIALSKKELGSRHAWAGHAAYAVSDFCVSGIYAWVRHPIYLGIIVADIGMGFLVIPRLNVQLQLSLTFVIGCVITFIFIIVSSFKETKFLVKKFGQPFVRYALRVYGFFPLRKFSNLPDREASE